MINRRTIKIIACSGLVAAPVASHASLIGTRADLNTLLGANQVFEDFETPQISTQTRYLGGPLDHETTIPGLGNHLVKPGVVFQRNPDFPITESGYRGIDWNPSGYFGSTSQALSGAGGCCSASIREDFQFIFTAPVAAFGLDLLAYSGFDSSGSVSVFDTAGTLLGTAAITGTVAVTFFGWENVQGIGKVFFHDVPTRNYIQFDNLGFGTAVPVPAAVWLFGSALLGLGNFGGRSRS